MRFEIKKEYKIETREYPHAEENDKVKTYEVEVLVHDQFWAMDIAEGEAAEQGYASFSLIRENHDMWVFDLYNKIPKREEADNG